MKKWIVAIFLSLLCLTLSQPACATTNDLINYVEDCFNVLQAIQDEYDANGPFSDHQEIIEISEGVTGRSFTPGMLVISPEELALINHFCSKNIYGLTAEYFFGPPETINPVIDYIETVYNQYPNLFDHPNFPAALDDWRNLVNGNTSGYIKLKQGETKDLSTYLVIIGASGTCSCWAEKCTEKWTPPDSGGVEYAYTYDSKGKCEGVVLLLALPVPYYREECCGALQKKVPTGDKKKKKQK